MKSLDDTIRQLQTHEGGRELLRDIYVGDPGTEGGERFLASAEFGEARGLVNGLPRDFVVLDLGAGNGVASYAWARAGARKVLALEPDPGELVGQGALRRLCRGLDVELFSGFAEAIPLKDACVDLVYVRQVLHHTRDLRSALRECYRVLRPAGLLLACREHVVDDAAQLAAFLAAHPVHRLAGGEHAYPLPDYGAAIESAGFANTRVIEPLESLINAFPVARSRQELERLPEAALARRLGAPGRWLASVGPVRAMVWRHLKRPVPGRLYSFLARKPA